jgi:archaellum component FlaC
MSEMLDTEGVKIDNQSQLMLWQLRNGEWERALTLRRAANLSENRQVFYRMENYLIPAGLVEEQPRDNPDDMRRFCLTEKGEEWVKERGNQLQMPTTHEQIQKYALEGYEAGTDAKESVQNYRKKLHRLKRRVERAEEDIEHVEDDQRENDKDVQYLRERSQAVRKRSIRNNNWLESLQDEVDEQAQIETVENLKESVNRIDRRLRVVESKQEGVARQQALRARERSHMRGLAKPAGYMALAAVVVYGAILAGLALAAPGLVMIVVLAGVVALIAIVLGIGGVLSAWAASTDETHHTTRTASPETAD